MNGEPANPRSEPQDSITTSSHTTAPRDHVVLRATHWFAQEMGLTTMRHATLDIYLIITARYLRLFAYGAAALILALYLQALGFSDEQIGLFMTLTLLGDVLISLLLTLVADALGRRTTLLFGALAMSASGMVFAMTRSYTALLLAAIFGVISPSGNEIGPFRAVEESTLAHLVKEADRADVYTWYVVLAVVGTSSGLAVGGLLVDGLARREGWDHVGAYRVVFGMYAGIGVIKAIMILSLSKKCEREEEKVEDGGRDDETTPLLNTIDTATTTDNPIPQNGAPKKPTTKPRFSFLTISTASLWTLSQLVPLFALDSLGSGMVPFSLINLFISRKFQLPASSLGGLMSATWFVSTVGNIFAGSLAKRAGLVQAMVATHLPSSIFLALTPIPSGLPLTVCLLVGRSVLSSMDQAPRSAFLALVVRPEERTAVMGIVNIVKILSQSGGPVVTGALAGGGRFWVAFVAAGVLKATYDVLLLVMFGGKVRALERERVESESVVGEPAQQATAPT